jgi:hypothetical protein
MLNPSISGCSILSAASFLHIDVAARVLVHGEPPSPTGGRPHHVVGEVERWGVT